MKAFRVLFVILMMIAAAPTRACSIGQNAFVPENYTESVRAFANKTAQELGSQDTPEARLKLAEALLTKAIQEFDSTCRGTFPGEGIAFDNEIDRRFGDDKSPKMRAIVLKALINKTNRALRSNIQIPQGNDASSVIERRYASDNDPIIQTLYVESLVFRATLTRSMPLYDEIVARYQDSKNPGVRRAVALALFNTAALIRQNSSVDTSVLVYNKIIRHFGSDTSPAVQEQVINALLEMHKRVGLQPGESPLALYDEIMRRANGLQHYDANATADMQELAINMLVASKQAREVNAVLRDRVMTTLLAKGKIVEAQNGAQAALDFYSTILLRYEKEVPNLRAKMSKQLCEGATQEMCDAIFRQDDDPKIQRRQLWALYEKANRLAPRKDPRSVADYQAALALYNEIEQRYGSVATPVVKNETIKYLIGKGDVLQKLNRHEAAISHYDNLMQRLDSGYEWVRTQEHTSGGFVRNGPLLPLILVEKGKALKNQGDLTQAVVIYDKAVTAYDVAMNLPSNDGLNLALLQQINSALGAKAAILKLQQKTKAANAVYDEMAQRIEKVEHILDMAYSICYVNGDNDACIYIFGKDDRDEPSVKERVLNAMSNKANRFFHDKDYKAALDVLNTVEQRYGKEKEPKLSKIVENILARKKDIPQER